MKRFLQKSLFRLHSLLLLLVMSVVGIGSAWADEISFDLNDGFDGWNQPLGGYPKTQSGITVIYNGARANGRINIHNNGNGWLKITSDVATITKVEMLCYPWQGSTASSDKAATVGEWDGVEAGGSHVSKSSMTTDNAKAIWQGTASTVLLTSTDDIDICNLVVYYEPLPSVDYSFTVTSDHALPAEFTPSVMVDGDPISENTYSTPKLLTASNITATTPDGWYYEVAADDEHEHAFVVTYKEYLHYNVTVTGCSEASAGVRYDSRTYKTGDKIQVKTALDVNDLEVVHVNGYDEQTPIVGDFDGYNVILTIPYTDADIKSYTVTISGMPVGASVKIEEEVFNADGSFTHQSRKDLDRNFVSIQNCPESHFTNESYEWYNEEDKEFNIVFTPYLVYTVAVDDASAYSGAEAGVKVYNSYVYHSGETIKNKTALTENDVRAIDVDGYTGNVTLSGDVFTVSYAKNDFITFDAYKFYSREWQTGELDESIENVRLQVWNSGDYFAVNGQDASHIVLTSSAAPIVKVEMEYINYYRPSYGYDVVDSYNSGSSLSTTDDITTWTGSTKSLELWQSSSTAYVSLIKVWLAKPTTYHVNITGMPAEGATVVVNNDYTNGYYTADGNYDYDSFDELTASSVNTFAPQSHKVDKTYTEGTHTFDITYTALTQYSVVADADNAYTGTGAGLKVTVGVDDYRWPTFDDTFYFDGTLEGSAIEVREVDGYTGSFVLDNDADPKTITVKYVENTPETYTVEFTGVVPEGASVTITDAAGDHIVNYAGIDKTFQSKYTITEASAKAKAFEFYDATVALDGTTFTVNYSKVDYIYVDLTNSEGRNLIRQSSEGTVAVNYNAYKGCANLYAGDPITVNLYSVEYDIAKIEYVRYESYGEGYPGTSFTAGGGAWTTEFQIWEAGDSNTKVVTVDAGVSGSDICYTAVKVWVKDAQPVATFAMSDAEWATLCIYQNFTVPEGYTAYTVGALVGGTATLADAENKLIYTEITDVPAGTPVLLNGPAAASVDLYAPARTPDAVVVNYLQGNASNSALTMYASGIADQGFGYDSQNDRYEYGVIGSCQLYQLAKENDVLGFYRQVEGGATIECAAHKAILAVPASAASSNARFVLPGQEEGALTGIDAIAAEGAEAIYNLQGQRVNATKAGVYVKNGRKVIVK